MRRCKFWDLKNASAWPPVVLAAGGGVRAKVGVGVYSSIGNSTTSSSSSSSSSSLYLNWFLLEFLICFCLPKVQTYQMHFPN